MANVEVHRPTTVDDSAKTRDELLRTILGHAPIIVFAVDEQGVITSSEGKGLQLLGLKPGERVGQSVLEAYGQLPDVESKFRRALAGESSSTSVKIGQIEFEIWHTPLVNSEGESAGVAGIAIDVTQRKRAEAGLRSARRLLQRILDWNERDRRLIAYEIHDGLVQDATGAQMQLQALLAGDQLPAGDVRQKVELAADLVGKAVSEARQLIGGLRPPILDELGIVPAIEYLVEGGQTDGRSPVGPSVEFISQVQFDRLEPLLEATIYRIVQEAMANARQHSQSDRVEIRLTQVDDRIHVEIQDWGIGFDPARVMENRFGLQGIRERARLLRGRALIDSAPGKGTRVFVDLPIAEALAEVSNTESWSIE